ncbi:nuclear transport factor 2 family protein [Gordonia phosphorivorans]|uniref:Nuclear transport factor 2 family protein n=1 Tax=Gordonia phosphorivorans TaxID=1056982 RepID=A0ABV6HB03_9ACTN
MTESIVRRVADLEAAEQIKALKYRYWRACDGKDPDGFSACFVSDGAVIDYGRMGSFDDAAPMVEIFRRFACAQVGGRYVVLDMHHGTHPVIEITGPDSARGRWSLQFRQLNVQARTETLAVGEYDDEYVRVDGRWLMSVCRFTEQWSHVRPLGADEVVNQGRVAVSGAGPE